MTNTDIRAIILAAGKGTRMKSQKPKVLHEIFGKALLGWVLRAIEGKRSYIVGGHKIEQVREFLKKYNNFELIEQKEQKGTGHAVMMCQESLKDYKGKVIILCGDTPLITKETIDKFIEYHNTQNADLTVMSAIFNNPTGYGRIIRKSNNTIEKIVEEKDANENQKAIKEVNAGIYCLNWDKISPLFSKLESNNAQNEYYLTDIISLANSNNLKTAGYVIEDNTEIFGINSRIQLEIASQIMKNKKLEELMESGVTIADKSSTNISPETEIGADTIILPNTYIEGKNTIGSNCKIGPMSHLRGDCVIGDFVKIGNFVEIKKATIASHTNVSHLSYVGDAKIGEHVNIGAGTITANYNSITKEKKQTIIGDGASIGSNTVLVAPVELKNKAFIGAGSVITKNVSEASLSLTRSEQKEYKNWVSEKEIKK